MKYIVIIYIGFFVLLDLKVYAATPDFCSSIVTSDINDCSDYVLRKSDKKLNLKYKELLNILQQPELKEILIRSQRHWIFYRDRTCQMYQPNSDGKYPDGSYAGSEAYAEKKQCEADVTESRVTELEIILDGGANYSYRKAKSFIVERFYQGDSELFVREILTNIKKNEDWMSYAVESCRLNNRLYDEEINSCLARLAFFD